MIQHHEIILPAFSQGCHLITSYVLDELTLPQVGLLHLFLQHTSAALCIQENASPEVQADLHVAFQRLVPESPTLYTHNDEGADDMPAHIKAALVGVSLSIPIARHELMLGTWQGIYLMEFRRRALSRKIIVSLFS
jgi:secondary thiamine-phosphate synthase enzyme